MWPSLEPSLHLRADRMWPCVGSNVPGTRIMAGGWPGTRIMAGGWPGTRMLAHGWPDTCIMARRRPHAGTWRWPGISTI